MLATPLLFAHRGGRAHGPDNRRETFETALRLGATGLETDVWLTRDGVPVLHHDDRLPRQGLRRKLIAGTLGADLPNHVIPLVHLFEVAGPVVPISIDLKDSAAATPILEVARKAGVVPSRLWVCHPDPAVLTEIRAVDGDVRLVNSVRKHKIKEGVERRAALLKERGLDALNMHHSDWTLGSVTLVHRFGILAFAWDVQIPRVADAVLRMGTDAIYGDDVGILVDALKEFEVGQRPDLDEGTADDQ